MNRPTALAISALVLATGFAPGTTPRVVISTPAGDALVVLAPGSAPRHVRAFLDAVDAGELVSLRIDRAQGDTYVQFAAPAAIGLRDVAPEHGAVGNVRGAVSVYDGPDADPTILIALVDSPHLDRDYTPIGWVESGLDAVLALSRVDTDGEGVPRSVTGAGPIESVDPGAPVELRPAVLDGGEPGRAPTATWVLSAVAAAATAAIALWHRRLAAERVTTLLLAAALVGFFAAWVGIVGGTGSHPYLGLACFVLVIGVFRLMGRFERPEVS